jgi:short subunit dehydrogenase-like uncharacterized protein
MMMRPLSERYPLILYGAAGVTGRLVLAAAVKRGLSVILAGRRRSSLEPVASAWNLPLEVAGVEDRPALVALARKGSIVLNAAGPFAATAEPVASACLAAGAAYLDMSGEVDSLIRVSALDEAAHRARLPLLCGAGYGVAVAECLASHVAARAPGAVSLRIGMDTRASGRSPGAGRSFIHALSRGNYDMLDGAVRARRFADAPWTVELGGVSFFFAGAPLAEAWAAARSSGVRNVRAGVRMKAAVVPVLKLVAAAATIGPVGRWMADRAGSTRRSKAPVPAPATSTAIVEAFSADDARSASAIRIDLEGYAAAAEIAVLAALGLDSRKPAGFHTPASAFGADFIMELHGTIREDLS